MVRQRLIDIGIPLAVLILLTVVLHRTNADLRLAALFYQPSADWMLRSREPWRLLYDYAWVPAAVMCMPALILLVAGLWHRPSRRWRKIAAFLVLLLLLGPGLMVNLVFKEHWGRPRPKEIVDFGGTHTYLQVWQRGEAMGNGSFPSGHASIGFFLIAPYFVFRKQSRQWAWFFLAGGTVAGGLVGIARIGQGGHFVTDVLWAWGFVYLTGLVLAMPFHFERGLWCGPPASDS